MNQKGMSSLVILGAVVVVILAGGLFYLNTKKITPNPVITPASTTVPVVSPSPENVPDTLVVTGTLDKTATGAKVVALYSLIQSLPKAQDGTYNCPNIDPSNTVSYTLDFSSKGQSLMKASWSYLDCGGLFLVIGEKDRRVLNTSFFDSLADIVGVTPQQLKTLTKENSF